VRRGPTRRWPRLAGSGALLATALGASPARALDPPDGAVAPPAAGESAPKPSPAADVIAAAELFRQGRAALEAKDVATARARLVESARLSPRVGTLISLAECEEELLLLASARTHWQSAVDLATGQGDARRAFAETRLAAIDARVPRMTLRLPAGVPARTTVRVDDVDLGAASVGFPLPAEIGRHTLRVDAPEHAPVETVIELAEGEQRDVDLTVGPPTPTPALALAPARGTSPLRIASYVALGLGAAAAGTGAYFGVEALHGKNVDGCTGNACNTNGARLRDDAISDGNVATGVFVGAGALLVAGGVLWFVSAPPKATAWRLTPALDARRAGVSVDVAW
jgi:hypothetical protein